MLLYPRLRHTTARKIALGLSGKSIAELASVSRTTHEDAIWSPTGGRKASESELATIRQEVLRIAEENRYPDTKARTGRRLFDADVGAWLHQNLHLSAHEAASGEVWAALTSRQGGRQRIAPPLLDLIKRDSLCRELER